MQQLDQMRKGTTTVAILKLLADAAQPMHGYQIIQALSLRSRGDFQFKEGLIYPRLHQMEQTELLASQWEGESGGRQRKVYRITDAGRQALAAELEQWRSFSQSMDRLLGLAG